MFGLQLTVVPGSGGNRPWLMVRPDGQHELFRAQQDGMDMSRLVEIVLQALPCDGSA